MEAYIIDFSKSHFTDKKYYDLEQIQKTGTFDVNPFFFDKDEKDPKLCDFQFKLMFQEALNRDFLSSDTSWPVFSKKFCDLFVDKVGVNFFLKEITILSGIKNEVFGGYCIVRPPLLNGIVDLDNSIYEPHPVSTRRFGFVDKIVLNKNIELPPLFRIYEYPGLLLANGWLIELIKPANLSGIQVTLLSEFED